MKGGYYLDKRTGTWRVWFPLGNKKQLLLSYYTDGARLTSEQMAHRVWGSVNSAWDEARARNKPFDVSKWKKIRASQFVRAWETYKFEVKVGTARTKDRDRIYRLYFYSYFKDRAIDEIGKDDVRDFHAHLPEKLKPITRKAILKTLNGFLHHFDIFLKMPKIQVDVPAVRWLTDYQQEQVLEFIPARHQGIFRFLLLYGCRVSESCNLRRENLDWEKRLIYIVGRKAHDSNTLPILPEMERWLRGMETIGSCGGEHTDHGKIMSFNASAILGAHPCPLLNLHYVFSQTNGKPYSRFLLRDIWKRASKLANQKYGTLILPLTSAARKSRACQALNQGADIASVARLLGNSVSVVEKYYARVTTQRVAEVLSFTKSLQKEDISTQSASING